MNAWPIILVMNTLHAKILKVPIHAHVKQDLLAMGEFAMISTSARISRSAVSSLHLINAIFF